LGIFVRKRDIDLRVFMRIYNRVKQTFIHMPPTIIIIPNHKTCSIIVYALYNSSVAVQQLIQNVRCVSNRVIQVDGSNVLYTWQRDWVTFHYGAIMEPFQTKYQVNEGPRVKSNNIIMNN
jgi:hypothetical protein